MNAIVTGDTLSLTQQMMPTSDEIRRARRRLHRKAALIFGLAVGSYVGLVFAPVGFVVRVLFALVLVIASVTMATSVMHDGNHGAFSASRRVNRIAGWSSDLLGASSFLWRFKHNRLHHGNTNVVGYDLDIDQMPFARLAPQQQWHPRHRYQHIYMWFLYGFLTLQWLVLGDFSTLVRGKQGTHPLPERPRPRDVALILFGKVVHVSWALVLPMFFHPWWGVLGFYLASSWLVGFLLANCFQLAHCVDRAEFFGPDAPRRGPAFELHQLKTTVDIRCRMPIVRRFVRWLMGGLDFQVEHHLAPKLPHTLYPEIAPRLEAACAARGVTYRAHASLTEAIRSHARWLRLMGEEPR
ncbi:MAG: acyl-CoA desaturase [Actinobacteria bacterium]|nr:acyl-CoA desaturase [Actinomycetota bacterium]